jgi:hypothetical protein
MNEEAFLVEQLREAVEVERAEAQWQIKGYKEKVSYNEGYLAGMQPVLDQLARLRPGG